MQRHITLIFVFAKTPMWALERPAIFSELMVLQQEMPVRIWGKAKPGASVTVEFAGQKVATKAAKDGSWSLYLKPLEASFE